MRKSIARVLTVINQKKKAAVREAFADKVPIAAPVFTPLLPPLLRCEPFFKKGMATQGKHAAVPI